MINLFEKYDIIFWDFDGVIKDSVEIKGQAFKSLFNQFGDEVVQKVEKHHCKNGGISRYEKIPLYLNWSGVDPNTKMVEKYAKEFSRIVINSVIECDWVEGVKEYILKNYNKQLFILVTATPQDEIEIILNKLEIYHCFKNIYGSPNKKGIIINQTLNNYKNKKSVMIGDSISDYNAAFENQIDFILRSTPLNLEIQKNDNIKKFSTLK